MGLGLGAPTAAKIGGNRPKESLVDMGEFIFNNK